MWIWTDFRHLSININYLQKNVNHLFAFHKTILNLIGCFWQCDVWFTAVILSNPTTCTDVVNAVRQLIGGHIHRIQAHPADHNISITYTSILEYAVVFSGAAVWGISIDYGPLYGHLLEVMEMYFNPGIIIAFSIRSDKTEVKHWHILSVKSLVVKEKISWRQCCMRLFDLWPFPG